METTEKKELTREEYIHYKAFSYSSLSQFKRSPEHYKYYKDFGSPDQKYFAFGRAFHTLVLEPDKFKDEIEIFDSALRPDQSKGMTAKANKEWKNLLIELAKENKKTIISTDEHETIKNMAEKVLSNPVSAELLNYSRAKIEVAKTWSLGKSKCKSLEDISSEEFGADLKTTNNADPDIFMYSILKFNYYIQAGMYMDGYFNGHAGYNFDREFFFINVEKEAPYGVSVIRLTKEYLLKGIEEYRDLVIQAQSCIDLGLFESYQFKAPIDAEGIFDAMTPYQLRD